MSKFAYIDKIPSKSISSVLQRFADYCESNSQKDNFLRPIITVYIEGTPIKGGFYKLGKDNGENILLMETSEIEQDSIAYIPVGEIEALIVNNAKSIAEVLSFGALNSLEPVSNLQFNRQLKTIADEINSSTGANFTIECAAASPEANAGVVALLEMLLAELKTLAQDNFAKEAIKAFNKITIQNISGNKSAVITKNGSEILLQKDFTEFNKETLAYDIKSGLNSVL